MQLEVRLAEKEESLLERDLIFEQVSRLSDRIKSRADAGKNDTLTLAKDVRYHKKISLYTGVWHICVVVAVVDR